MVPSSEHLHLQQESQVLRSEASFFYLPLFLFKLPVPHGAAKEDCLPRNTGELSCKVRHFFPANKYSVSKTPVALNYPQL